MNIGRLTAGLVSLALAVILYLSGYPHYVYSSAGDFLSTIRIYPAGFFAVLGLVLVGTELIRDMRAREL
jgi:hypothetical protein